MNLKDLFVDFFKSKGHVQIPSAPVVPENDPTCLFNTAGMQPLVSYLMGQPHPEGTRLVDYQKCIRLTDLDSIGDKTHHTFFEMLGNWSLGDYFKKESLTWSFEFLTEVLNIPKEKIAVSVFKGNDLVKADEVSANIWKDLGIKEEKIVYLGEEDNWWGPANEFGPCGPDSEIFYFRSEEDVPKIFDPNDERWVEIWNNVFMEYNKTNQGYELLQQKNVDTGMGYERTIAILEKVNDNYLSSVWIDVIKKIEQLSGLDYDNEKATRSMRIIADHIRTCVIIASEGITPSNTDQGYVLRRLMRRAINHANKLGIDMESDWQEQLGSLIINKYKKYYKELEINETSILSVLSTEKNKFIKTLNKGLKEFDKIVETLDSNYLSKELAFKLYDTYGFPIDLTKELASNLGIEVDIDGFNQKFHQHQEKSRQGATQKFKGGLSGDGQIETKYHTATHLLNAVLKQVLGNHVHQMGSNITPDRMRFDFSHDSKLTDLEKQKIETLMNQYIDQGIEVIHYEIDKPTALKSGAEAMFIDKYGDIVTVYEIVGVSKEICGGPHVQNTEELGYFKLVKEEAVSSGVRRIKAILTVKD